MEVGRYPNKLKMFRRCQGYSQKTVARLLGLADTSTLSRWERGNSMPSLIQVLRLTRIYHAVPSELYAELWDQILADTNLVAQEEESFNSN